MKRFFSTFLTVTLFFTVLAGNPGTALASDASALPELIPEITIDVPGKDLQITMIMVADKALMFGGQPWLYLPQEGQFTLSRDVAVFSAEELENGELRLFGYLESGKAYSITEYFEAIRLLSGNDSYVMEDFLINSVFQFESDLASKDSYKAYGIVVEVIDVRSMAIETAAAEEPVSEPESNGTSEWTFDRVHVKVPELEGMYTFASSGVVAQYSDLSFWIAVESKDDVAKVPEVYFHGAGVVNVQSAHTSQHFGENNYVFVVPSGGSFGFEGIGMDDTLLGWVDSPEQTWEEFEFVGAYEGGYNDGTTEKVFKLRFEENDEMRSPGGIASALNILFVFTDNPEEYGEPRSLSDLAIEVSDEPEAIEEEEPQGQQPDDVSEGPSPAEEYRTLQRTSSGKRVARLQTALVELGLLDDKIDGKFGRNTEAAVKAFQEANNLEVTGIADPETQAKLYGE